MILGDFLRREMSEVNSVKCTRNRAPLLVAAKEVLAIVVAVPDLNRKSGTRTKEPVFQILGYEMTRGTWAKRKNVAKELSAWMAEQGIKIMAI